MTWRQRWRKPQRTLPGLGQYRYQVLIADAIPGEHYHFGEVRADNLAQAEGMATARLREAQLTRADAHLWQVWAISSSQPPPGYLEIFARGTRNGTLRSIRMGVIPELISLNTLGKPWHGQTTH